MKLNYVLILLGWTVFLKAQTLTQANHSPQAGDTFTLLSCDSSNVLPGNAGTNVVWDFSTVTVNSFARNYSVCPTAGAAYPLANTGFNNGIDTVSYFKPGANTLEYYGGVIPVSHWNAVLEYTSPALVALYPMSLNTSTTSVTGGSINIIQFDGVFNGTCNVVADGLGTLILPGTGAIYNNTLRVVTTQTIDFVAHTAPGSFIKTDYDYYVPGVKRALFSISVTSSTISGGNPPVHTLTFVTIYKGYEAFSTVGLSKLQTNDPEFHVFPNPANTMLHFAAESKNDASLFIYNAAGKLQATLKLDHGKASVDVSSYKKGMYAYRIQDERGLQKTGRSL